MNAYVDNLIESILDGSRPIEEVRPEVELAKIGLAFVQDAIRDAEAEDAALSKDIDKVFGNGED